jgi:SAM-dependent methyltransferase
MTEAPRGSGRNITGAEYVRALTTHESDRLARTSFRTRALTLTTPGSLIYDFGAGPGLDARFYAEHDRRVAAYDVDPQMCSYFSDYCREFINSGRITLQQGDYVHFLAGARTRSDVDLVTANFAPLNLVGDLAGLFAALAGLTHARGQVLAGVLSPFYVGDLRYRWWWRNLPRLLRVGRYAVPGAQAPIWRRRLADYALASEPHFRLERVFAGTSTRPTSASVTGLAAGRATSWLSLSRTRYMFLLFGKPAAAGASRS